MTFVDYQTAVEEPNKLFLLQRMMKEFSNAGLPHENLYIPDHCKAIENDFVAYRVSSTEELYFKNSNFRSGSSHVSKVHMWLAENGTPIAYLTVYFGDNPTGKIEGIRESVIASVEVRPGYKGRGLACRVVKAAELYSGHVIHSTGHYTPEGFGSLVGKFPYTREAIQAKKAAEENSSRSVGIGVYFDSVSFVADWDLMQENSIS